MKKALHFEMKAWTGGSHPKPWNKIPLREKRIAVVLFRQMLSYYRLAWGEKPDKDTELLFFNRSRYDAHATCNQQIEK
jgi:hypothetical protein